MAWQALKAWLLRWPFFKDLFTEKDGESFCPVRFGFITGILLYFCFSIHDIMAVKDFKFMEHARDFASGLGDILGFGGGAVAVKSLSEKDS